MYHSEPLFYPPGFEYHNLVMYLSESTYNFLKLMSIHTTVGAKGEDGVRALGLSRLPFLLSTEHTDAPHRAMRAG